MFDEVTENPNAYEDLEKIKAFIKEQTGFRVVTAVMVKGKQVELKLEGK